MTRFRSARLPMRTTAWMHDRQHRGLQAEEQRLDEADIAERGIDAAQRHDGDDAGQDEQAAGHDAAGGPVHQPADIGGELLRLRSGQQHAVVQRVQEPALAKSSASPRPGCGASPRSARPGRRSSAAAIRSQTRKASPKLMPCPASASARRLACSDIAHGLALLRRPVVGLARSRRGTSDRRRRRAPCRPRAARGRRHTCATARARPRAGPAPPARDRAAPVSAPRTMVASRSSGSVSRGRIPRP